MEFQAERAVLADAIQELVQQLRSANYDLTEPLAIGSTAIVWKVRDRNLDVDRALKLPRPRLGKVSEIISIIRTERKNVASLNHPNLIRVYFAQQLEVRVGEENYEFPYFVMDFLEGIQDLDEYIIKHRQTLTAEQIITYFRDILAGLRYLHGRGFIHCDVKPANLLIATATPALVSDLGYAKPVPRLPREDKAMTTVTYTPTYAHPRLREHMVETSDSNANKAVIRSAELQVAFDLYAFGRTMQEVLSKLRDAETADPQLQARRDVRSALSPYQWQYLELVSRRLLDGHVQAGKEALDAIPGLPASIMQELKYETADEALEDMEKLLHLYDLEGEVPELNPEAAAYLQIPLAKAALSPRVRRIVNHPALTRLGQVTQLGFVSLVYPGATHSRLEHILGTYAACCEYVRALWYDEASCLFRSVMRRSDLELVLVSALLHDVSQYPMAHDLAESSSAFSHESFLEGTLRASFAGGEATLEQLLRSDWDLEVDDVLKVISPPSNSGFRLRVLHSITSGPLDCDKLDYLRRDSTHLGVSYGEAVDHERLLRNLTVVYEADREPVQDAQGRSVARTILRRAEVGVFEKALAAAQGLWRARQDMFRQVYWQHTVRSFKAMLGFVVRRVLLELGKAKPDDRERFWRSFNDWLFDWRTVGVGVGAVASVVGHGSENRPDASDFLQEGTSNLEPLTSLAPTDDSLLSFLSRWADSVGKAVLTGVRLRHPYRRVAVMSRAISSEDYDSIYHQFSALRWREDLEAIERLRARWQAALLRQLEAQLDEIGVTVLPGGHAPKDAIGKMRAVEPFLLVDVPVKATSGSAQHESLLYVSEDVSGVHPRTSSFPEVEEVPINLTQESFDREVGKIRVFVVPQWAEIVARYLSDRAILDTISFA